MGRKKPEDPGVDNNTDEKPIVDEEEDNYKHCVIYIICDLNNQHRGRINRRLKNIFTVFQVTDIFAVRNDLMDGLASRITMVLYADQVGGQSVGPQVVELCQKRGITHLPLCEDLCNRIIEDPCCLLP